MEKNQTVTTERQIGKVTYIVVSAPSDVRFIAIKPYMSASGSKP